MKTVFSLGAVSCALAVLVGCANTSSPESSPPVQPPVDVDVGDSFRGGVVVYLLQEGDAGYDPDAQHGLIAAQGNLEGTVPWSLSAYAAIDLPDSYGTAVGAGKANTDAIVAQNGAGAGYAAGLCAEYANPDSGTGSYDDWYLPSVDEMKKLEAASAAGFIDLPDYEFGNGNDLPPTVIYRYWTSSSASAGEAVRFYRGDDTYIDTAKDVLCYVRPVRAF